VYSGNSQSKQYTVTLYPPGGTPLDYSVEVVSSALTGNRVPQAGTMSVTARDASLSAKDMGRPDANNVFSKSIAGYVPADYIVSFTGSNGKTYKSKAYPAATDSKDTVINLIDADVGISVENASDLQGMSSTDNFSLAADIDLAETGTDWVGPTSYSGNFYGNGHTVKLVLSSRSGDIGLFRSLAGNAQIRDLVVDVSSPAGGILINSYTHFGGVVGFINVNSALPILLDNVKVKGELVYKDGTTGYTVVGGFIGEVYRNTSIHVNFQNCVSEINITEDFTTLLNPPNITQLYTGGFIGRGESNIEFTNCYATGAISVVALNGANTYVGGFIGFTYAGSDPNVRMTNCYSAGTVSATFTAASPSALNVGGFSGGFLTTNANAYIQNCVAIGTDVSATSNGTINIGRIVGTVSANKLTGNYALSSMSVTKNDTADTTVSSGTETDKNGAGKTDNAAAGGLRNAATWTGLSFSPDVWDFSGLATGWPVLK
jgi:hypothetical protein